MLGIAVIAVDKSKQTSCLHRHLRTFIVTRRSTYAADGITGQQAVDQILPVDHEEITSFNPTGGYGSFLLPALMGPKGLWYSTPATEVLAMITAAALFLWWRKREASGDLPEPDEEYQE